MGITIICIVAAVAFIYFGVKVCDSWIRYDFIGGIMITFGVISAIVSFIMLCALIINPIKAPYEVGAFKAKAESYQYLVDNPPTTLTLDQNNLYREIIEFNKKVQIAQSKSDSFWFMGWYPKQWKEIPLIEFHT